LQKAQPLLICLLFFIAPLLGDRVIMPVKIVTSTQPVEGPKFVNVFNQNGEVALGFKNDSNVTQTPDGNPLVSQESGSHLDASLSLNLGFKKGRGIKGLNFDFGLGKIDYLDSKFTNRQSENIIFGVSFQKKYAKGNKRITSTSKSSSALRMKSVGKDGW
jgi:hypothetical protein